MVQTITPVVYGSRRTYRSALAVHALGASVAAAVFGASLGALGAIFGAPGEHIGPVLIGTTALLYAGRELLRIPVPLPHLRRQVPEWWRTFYGPHTAAFLYGAGLGVGWLTHLAYGSFAAAALVAAATGSPIVGALICLPFALARVASTALANRLSPTGDLVVRVSRLEDFARSSVPRLVNGAALIGVAGAAASTML